MASKNREAYFSSYQSQQKWKSNRELKLLRQLKLFPENSAQIEAAIGNMVYRRKTPGTPVWTKTMRRQAQLLREFCGSGPVECFSSNPKVKEAAMAKLGKDFSQINLPEGKVDFSIGYRIANPAGVAR
jgi:hypothetical protein